DRGVVRQVTIEGGPVAGVNPVIGGDGIELVDGFRVYVTRGSGPNRVAALDLALTPVGWYATWVGEVTDPSLDVPTTTTASQGKLWPVTARYGVGTPESATYSITGLTPPN